MATRRVRDGKECLVSWILRYVKIGDIKYLSKGG